MIGGADIILGGQTRAHDADFLVRGIRSEWPNALIQRVDEHDAVPARQFRLPLVGLVELFLYRDTASYLSWGTYGATADNQAAMIHMIVSDDSVTLVVDHENSALADLARELLGSLRPNRIVLRAA